MIKLWNRCTVSSLLLLTCCFGTTHAYQSELNDDATAVKDSLNELKNGVYSGIAEKLFCRLGDRTALLILEQNNLTDIRQEATAIAISKAIALSFSAPRLIASNDNVTPKMSILLISYLERTATSYTEKQELNRTEQILTRQAGIETSSR